MAAKTATTPSKAAKAKAAKAKAAKADKAKAGLTTPELRVLKIIAKSKGGLTRPKVAAAVAKLGIACYNGRISNETLTYAALTDGGYLKAVHVVDESAGVNEVVYTATAKGKAEAAKK